MSMLTTLRGFEVWTSVDERKGRCGEEGCRAQEAGMGACRGDWVGDVGGAE